MHSNAPFTPISTYLGPVRFPITWFRKEPRQEAVGMAPTTRGCNVTANVISLTSALTHQLIPRGMATHKSYTSYILYIAILYIAPACAAQKLQY